MAAAGKATWPLTSSLKRAPAAGPREAGRRGWPGKGGGVTQAGSPIQSAARRRRPSRTTPAPGTSQTSWSPAGAPVSRGWVSACGPRDSQAPSPGAREPGGGRACGGGGGRLHKQASHTRSLIRRARLFCSKRTKYPQPSRDRRHGASIVF